MQPLLDFFSHPLWCEASNSLRKYFIWTCSASRWMELLPKVHFLKWYSWFVSLFCLLLTNRTETTHPFFYFYFLKTLFNISLLFLSMELRRAFTESQASQIEHFLNSHPPATLWDTTCSCLLTQTSNQPITRQQLKHLGTRRRDRVKLPRFRVTCEWGRKVIKVALKAVNMVVGAAAHTNCTSIYHSLSLVIQLLL